MSEIPIPLLESLDLKIDYSFTEDFNGFTSEIYYTCDTSIGLLITQLNKAIEEYKDG